MSTIIEFTLLIVIGVAVIVSLVYISKASTSLRAVDGYSKDTELSLAYTYTTWCTATCWILLILLAGGLILLLVFGPELLLLWGGILLIGLVVLLGLFAFTIGVLASISAYYISKSKLYSKASEPYRDCVISAVISLVTVGVIGLTFLYIVIRKYQRDKKIAEAQQNLRRVKTENYVRELLERESEKSK